MRSPPFLRVPFPSRGALLLAALAAALALPAGEAAADDRICIRTGTVSPTINGVVAAGVTTGGCVADPFWAQVTPVETVNASMIPGGVSGFLYAAVRNEAGTANDRLFVGIDVSGDEDLSDQDVVVLMFDANNNDTWDAGDFYLRIVVSGQLAPIESGTQCNQTVGTIEYIERTDTGWEKVDIEAVAGAVEARMAYDYDDSVGDPGEIWNLELALPINLTIDGTQYYNNSLSGAFFGLGAYLFIDDGHFTSPTPQEGYVTKWPASMVNREIGQQNPGGIPQSQPAQLADASVADVCFDVNFASGTPWEINSTPAGEFDNRIYRTEPNDFKVTFYFDGPGDDPTTLKNRGTIKLRLKPFHAGGAGPVWELSALDSAMTFNAFKSVTFTVDLDAGGAPAGWPASINFICADLVLEGFTRDDIASNNLKNINHNYFTTSTYAHAFTLGAVDVPGLRPGENASILLRVKERNGMGGRGDGSVARRIRPDARGGLLGVAGLGVLLLGMTRMGRRRSRHWRAAGALLMALGVGSCVLPQIAGLTPDEPQWTFRNADRVGLQPVREQPGWYQVQIPYGETRQVDIEFQGGPLPYETRRMEMPPVVDGRPNVIRVPVRAGELQTVLAFGTVDVDGEGPLRESGAGGVVMRQQPNVAGRRATAFVLRAGRYAPNEHAGALIGSFDSFETSFVVGRGGSIVVPEGATELSLSVNLPLSNLQAVRGMYQLALVSTPGPRVPAHTEIQGDGTIRDPLVLPVWWGLASLDIDSYYVTTSRGEDGRPGRTRNFLGSAHYSIYQSHAGTRLPGVERR